MLLRWRMMAPLVTPPPVTPCTNCRTGIESVSETLGGTERKKSQTIEVRVLRKWITKGKKEELCYQFVDIYGDGIEAAAEVKQIEHFDLMIKLDLFYRVKGYICTSARTCMATVEHVASLVIGQKAVFEPLTNLDIPSVCFNFATYDTLKRRIRNPKLLTDYIGHEMKREVEITLWPEKRHLIGDDVIPGDIVAITSTLVTEHNGRLQLESTFLTTVTINPDVPQTIEHVNRLRAVPAVQSTEAIDKTVTILDLKVGS
ncbi:hypothetical protein CASFOL_017507 [Castilleja foliolosa]|uniref:Uncharacterized protein n=1 Tax=Castilleja foliolosa TaxID=1961234 RepID=A0ABD3DB77_9LAMI